MAKKDTSSGIFEKLTPILLIATIVLAFGVGVLWQKVSYLEGGKTLPTPSGNSAGSGAAAPSTSPLSDLTKLATDLGISEEDFNSCYDSGKYKDRVESDYQEGIAAGVTGTPGNFVLNGAGDVWFIPGAFPISDVKTTVDIALGGGGNLPSQIVKLDSQKASAFPGIKESDV